MDKKGIHVFRYFTKPTKLSKTLKVLIQLVIK